MKKNVFFLSLALLIGLSTWTAKAATLVGTGQTYPTLKSAFDAINSGVLTGAVKLEITSDLTEATDFPILNASGDVNVSPAGTASYSSVHIYPTGGAWTISGSLNSQLITLNGADNVNIDGRLGGVDGDGSKNLTIINANPSGSKAVAISINASAESNTIQYCTLRSGGSDVLYGVILLGASVSGNGNDNNIITHNTIAGTTANSTTVRPSNGIIVLGTGISNDGGTISYNEFPQFVSPTLVSNGINFNGTAQTGWTISNNSFFEDATGAITTTGATAKTAIQIVGGTGFTINNNYIGGNAKECGGTLTKTAVTNNAFIGINLGLSADGTTSSIQGNTIKNISWSNLSTAIFRGIVVSGAGSVNVGTTTGNTIGGAGGSASAYAITYTATGNATFTGIEISTTGTADVQKNTVASIKTDNVTTNKWSNFIGINKTAVAGTTTISNNVVGSLTEAGSINCAKLAAAQQLYPINCAGTGTNTISNNTVSNIVHNTTTGQTYALRLNPTSASTTTVNANFIQKLDLTGATSGSIYGIYIESGVGTYTNNIISITTNNPVNIYGIQDQSTVNNNSNIYHNTVYIAGSPATLALSSYALNTAASSANTRDIRNNIFVNARTNNGATGGKHYAARFAATTGTLTLDYNNYFANGSGGVAGYYNALDVPSPASGTAVTIATGQDTHSIYANPTFANALTPAAAVDFITSPAVTLTANTNLVSTDYDGTARPTTPRMGAFEAGYINAATNVSDLTAGASYTVLTGNELTVNADKALYNLTIQPGGKVTNTAGFTLTPTNFKINSDANGTGTYVENGGTLTTTNTKVQQYLTTGRNWYISSPVASADRSVISNASLVYSRNEAAATWPTVSGALTLVKGYVAKVDGSTGVVTFTGGALNTGAQSITGLTMTGGVSSGYNLVGNPYPSYVNWESATKTNLLTTMWYRSKNVGNSAYVFDTYNATGSVGTNNNGTTVTRYIPPMQAFWVKVSSGTGTLAFTNSMRSHSGTYSLRAPAITTQQVLRLQVSNEVNTDEAIVLFNADALDTFDAFDSPKMTNGNVAVPEIYTTVGTESLVINGLNSLTTNRELPLGFNTGDANTFSIQVTELKNFDADTRIILKDNLLSTEQDITDGTAYSFTSDATNTATRFAIVFKVSGFTTGVIENVKLTVNIFTNANGQITINRNAVDGVEGLVSVFNTVGQKLVSTATTGASTVVGKSFNSGVYFVTVNVAGKSTTQKVIIN